jgi:hypothetical protein
MVPELHGGISQTRIDSLVPLSELPGGKVASGTLSLASEHATSFAAVGDFIDTNWDEKDEQAAKILWSWQNPSYKPNSHDEDSTSQQSLSNTCSSTNHAGKRKMSNSSQSSPSSKLKKGDIVYNNDSTLREDRHPTLEHTSEEGAAAGQAYSDSKRVYLTYKRRAGYAKGGVKDNNSGDPTCLEKSNKKEKNLDLSNWNFLREEQESRMKDFHQEEFLQFLNECRGEKKLESFFTIEEDQIKDFFKEFHSAKQCNKFNLPPRFTAAAMKTQFYEILLRISDRNIDLEGYPIFKEIMEEMKGIIQSNSHIAGLDPNMKKIGTTEEIVRDVTKLTHLLAVIYMTMFKKNKEKVLTEEEVQEILSVLKSLWLNLAGDEFESENDDKSLWKKNTHRMLTFDPQTYSYYQFYRKMDRRFHLSSNLFSYWLENTKFDCEDINPVHVIEVVNKLIYQSNHEEVSSKIAIGQSLKHKIEAKNRRKFKNKKNKDGPWKL